MAFSVGDRVRFADGEMFPSLGTVYKVSRAGYVRVRWDESSSPGLDDYFSPLYARRQLTPVFGMDAMERHVGTDGFMEGRCKHCNVEITDINWREHCPEPTASAEGRTPSPQTEK